MKSDRTVFVVMMNGDRAVGQSMSALIDSIGYTVHVYDSGEDFRAAHKPSLDGCLIIDLSLLNHGAFQFIEELASAGFHIPIIVTAEYNPAAVNASALPTSVIALLQKPFIDELLTDTIEHALARSHY